MEKLIGSMMTWANVTERELAERSEIPTNFGETLSWRYLCYVRERPVSWHVPTRILYGEHDHPPLWRPYRPLPGALVRS